MGLCPFHSAAAFSQRVKEFKGRSLHKGRRCSPTGFVIHIGSSWSMLPSATNRQPPEPLRLPGAGFSPQLPLPTRDRPPGGDSVDNPAK